jgi:hypothetical protein
MRSLKVRYRYPDDAFNSECGFKVALKPIASWSLFGGM